MFKNKYKRVEIPVNDEFISAGKMLRVVPDKECEGCVYEPEECYCPFACSSDQREDNTSVKFVDVSETDKSMRF